MPSTRGPISAALLFAMLATTVGAGKPAPSGTGSPASEGAGVVSNPSFDEGWQDGKLACWSLSGAAPGRLTVTRKAHSDFGAFAAGMGTAGTRLDLTSDRTRECHIGVSPAVAYRLRFWLQSTGEARPVVYAYSAPRGWYPWFNGTALAASALREYSVPLPAVPAGVSAISVGVGFDASTTVILDDVTLTTQAGQPVFRSSFPVRNGLVTNEYAFWSPNDPRSVRSAVWDMTSGSLFALNGNGYSGNPDDRNLDALSRTGNRSAVFRLTTHDYSFGDVSVRMNLNVHRLSSTRSTPRTAWDGVHLFLRYKNEYRLYYASVARRDGSVLIKKKCPGGRSNGGTYYELSPEQPGFPIPYGSWQKVGATVRDNSDGSVSIVLYHDDKAVASATDKGVGCEPITGAGAIGIRGDNAEFEFNDLSADSLS